MMALHVIVIKFSVCYINHSYPMFLVNETYMSGFFVSVDVVYFLFLVKVLNKFRDFSFPELLDHKVYHTVHLLV